MSDQSVNALKTGTGRFLLSTKGTAAPSPVNRKGEDPAERYIARFQSETTPANGLSGLIKRSNPIRHQQIAEPINIMDFRDQKAAIVQPVNKETPSPSPPTKRRQLTVRVEMEQFENIDRLSQSENRTYQSIQAEALKMYLKTRVDELQSSNDWGGLT